MIGLEKYSEGLHNYNEALHFIAQRNEDLAAIRLKRATELIPNFVEAMNLLALYCIKSGDKTRAAALVERVLAIDKTNPAARKYYQEIFQKKAPGMRKEAVAVSAGNTMKGSANLKATPQQKKNASGSPFAVQNQRVFTKSSPLSGIISFIVGLGVMFLFVYVLWMPSVLDDKTEQIATLESQMQALQEAYDTQSAQDSETIGRLRGELAEANVLTADQQEQILNNQNENLVNTAHVYLAEGMHAQSLAVLANVEPSRLSTESLVIYNLIKGEAMPVVEQYYFTAGQAYFNANDFLNARPALEHAALHITADSNIADHIFYLLGRIAEDDGNLDLARAYYEMIIDDFPGTPRATAAQNRLNAME
jgi:TolA-binding protein